MDAEFDEGTKTPTPGDNNHEPQSSSSTAQSSLNNNTELFTRHNDSVLCCSIDSRNRLAVSGGIDDIAFVWDLNTKHVIFECLGHKESVVAAAFSLNSTYVATGDLNGYIQVRNTTTGIKVFDFDIEEINWILWHNSSEFVLLAGTAKGDFWMWNVNDPAAVKTFNSYGSACTAAKLLPDGMKLVVSYQDGSLRLFDLKSQQTLAKLDKSCNSEIISLDLNPNKSVIAVGCIDSSIRLFRLNSLKEIGELFCKSPPTERGPPEQMEEDDSGEPSAKAIEIVDEFSGTDQSAAVEEDENEVEEDDESDDEGMSTGSVEFNDQNSVESVLFSPCGNFLAAANNSGSIIIWDVSSQAKRCETHTCVGVTRCAWTSDGRYITGSLDGRVRLYDINLTCLASFDAHNDQILDLAYRDTFVVTASEDKTCRVIRI